MERGGGICDLILTNTLGCYLQMLKKTPKLAFEHILVVLVQESEFKVQKEVSCREEARASNLNISV